MPSELEEDVLGQFCSMATTVVSSKLGCLESHLRWNALLEGLSYWEVVRAWKDN